MWSRTEFSQKVQSIKDKDASISYFDIIQDVCRRHEIELVVVPDLLTDGLKRKIAKEAHRMHMVKDEAVDFPNTIENAFGLEA